MSTTKIVIIGASWCSPCKVLKGFATDVLENKKISIPVVYLDVDVDDEDVEAFGITKLPTVVFESDKGEVSRFIGSKKEDFEKFVDEVSVHLTLDSAFAST